MKRERVIIPPRPPISPATRARVLQRFGHRCARPGCGVGDGLEVDHILCRELGGADHESNYEPLCNAHHKAKTRNDRRMIAKAHRLERAEDPETRRRTKRPMVSRGFDHALTKGFDGKVRARTPS